MSVGHSPGQGQWTPDMRKKDEDVTEQDVREAKRRIQGSGSAEDSPEDSGGDEVLAPSMALATSHAQS